MIKRIFLPQEISSQYFEGEDETTPLKVLDHLSQINIFVGENNSGKSRFLRKILIQNSLLIEQFDGQIATYNEAFNRFKNFLTGQYVSLHISNYGEIDNKLSQLTNIENIKTGVSMKQAPLAVVDEILGWNNIQNFAYQVHHSNQDMIPFHTQLIQEAGLFKNVIDSTFPDEEVNFSKIYIPTLRGLRKVGEKDYYATKTQTDYFSSDDINPKPKVFTGQDLYDQIKEHLLGDNSKREKISQYQNFLSTSFFDGEEIALVPKLDKDYLIVKIGNKEEPIHDKGDGIQSLIILTFNLFMLDEVKTLFFIEEPELYLHPGMQRKLLNVFKKHPNAQLFLTTHSNHLLDMTMDEYDMSVFTVKTSSKDNKREVFINNVSKKDDEPLELLGVKNSSVFLVNATIWVEGITDRLYLRHYLSLYIASLRQKKKLNLDIEEDTHYSFVEYGGNNITHWSFLDTGEEPTINVSTLCSKLLLITDKDGITKNTRKQGLKRLLDDRLIILPVREIENLISKEILSSVIHEYEGKTETELNLSNISENDYKSIYLGDYIHQILKRRTRKGGYKEKSGTIKNKMDFCKKTIQKTTNFNQLTPSTQELIKKIYKFIISQNRL